jgi:hypothetical protein
MAKKNSRGPIWLKAYLSEGSATFLNGAASARKAGYRARNEHSFDQIGYENRKKYDQKMAKWMQDHGLSEKELLIKTKDLLEARETVFKRLKGAWTVRSGLKFERWRPFYFGDNLTFALRSLAGYIGRLRSI